MPFENEETTFASHLATEVAAPILSRGYGVLVARMRGSADLRARCKDIASLQQILAQDEGIPGFSRKQNREWVTGFEQEAEAAMRAELQRMFPSHGVIGEEHGTQAGDRHCWIFDPIDGTSAMIKIALAQACGVSLSEPAPGFGTLVALKSGDAMRCGVVAEWRAFGDGLTLAQCYRSDRLEEVSVPFGNLQDATLACTAPAVMFPTPALWSGFQALQEATRTCVQELNCIGFMRLLTGQVQIVYESDLAVYDVAAIVPVLTRAGVVVTDEKGNPPSFHDEALTKKYTLLAAHPALHAQALAIVQQGVPNTRNRFAQEIAIVTPGYARKFE